jgi:hypothetical protein
MGFSMVVGPVMSKGFLACLLTSIGEINAGDLINGLRLVSTADEEVGCIGANHLLASGLLIPKRLIIGEPTSLRPARAGKGYCLAEITVFGTAAHSAHPEKGKSAIYHAARLITAIEELTSELATERHKFFCPDFTTLNVGMFLLIPFGVWMMLRYSLANSACVFEGLGIRASLKRSIFLSQGSRGKIFVMFLLAGVLIMVVSGAASLPVIVSAFKHPQTAGQVSLFMTIYLLVTGFVVTSLTTPIYGIGLTLFYYDARIRKEGFDIEWMMRRATPVELPDSVVLIPPTEASLG